MRRPTLDRHSPSIRLHMMTTQAWLNRIDAYAEDNLLSRSQAIRRLIDEALTRSQRKIRRDMQAGQP
jgi:hypothetical protein